MVPPNRSLSRRGVLKGMAATAIGFATTATGMNLASQAVAADAPSLFTFQFSDGVPDWERDAIQQGLQLGADYFAATFGIALEPVQIRGYADDDDLPGTYAAMGNASGITVRITKSGWTQVHPGFRDPRPPAQDMQEVVHEYFHTFQAQLSGVGNRPIPGAIWLVEGSAEYIGYRAVESHGLANHDAVRTDWFGILQRRPSPDLSTLETRDALQAGDTSYGLSALAVEFLTAASGLDALRVYFQGLRTQEWHDAFMAAFGMDAGGFYQQFAQYRQGGFK